MRHVALSMKRIVSDIDSVAAMEFASTRDQEGYVRRHCVEFYGRPTKFMVKMVRAGFERAREERGLPVFGMN